MSRPWRDIVTELAGQGAELSRGVSAEWDGMEVAQLVIPGTLFRRHGANDDEAWRGIAHALGDLRLVASLEAAGWVVVEEVIDEVTFVVARDLQDTVWAIGVASSDGDRRGYLETDMQLDGRAERIAFVEPLDTRSPAALLSALGVSSG